MTDTASVPFEVEAPFVHSAGESQTRFLTALRDDCVIWGRQCPHCDRVVVPANDHCETCGHDLGTWVDVGPEGVVTGRTVVSSPMPLTGLEPPFAVVRVRLDGADTDLLHLATDVDRVVPSARVKPVWAAEREGTIRDIERFAPVDEEVAEPAAADPDAEPVGAVRRHLRLPFTFGSPPRNREFAEGVRRGEILAVRCTDCGRLYPTPRQLCARCWAPCEGWEQVADSGTVTTFVVVNVPFYGQEIEIPYVLADILLDGADATVQHLIGRWNDEGRLVQPDEEVRIGMRVGAVWRDPADRRGFFNDDIDHFEPTGEPDVEPPA